MNGKCDNCGKTVDLVETTEQRQYCPQCKQGYLRLLGEVLKEAKVSITLSLLLSLLLIVLILMLTSR